MVHQVANSGLSILVMGCTGYALGYLNGMNPKITAIVWITAELARHIFDYIAIQLQAKDDNFDAFRGAVVIAVPAILFAMRQIPSPRFAIGFTTFAFFSLCFLALDSLSPFAGRNVQPIPATPFAPPPPPPPHV